MKGKRVSKVTSLSGVNGLVMGILSLSAACATLADGHAGLDYAPSARTGPFRVLGPGEVGSGRPAPFAMDDSHALFRDASVLDADDDPTTFGVIGYFAGNVAVSADAPPDRIVAFEAIDGRSFAVTGAEVLQPSLDWEAGTVGAPSVARRDGETWLFYASAGGVGLAKSADGQSFTKEPLPVVAEGVVPWGQGVPRSPGGVFLPDGSLRLFFEIDTASGPAIGELRSTDGVTWQPVGSGPALRLGTGLDANGVASPDARVRVSEEGRPILDVYYTAIGATGGHTVGLASRFLDAKSVDGPLVKSSSSMLTPSPKLSIREPCVVRFATFSLLFATENASKTSGDPAVIVGVAPALAIIPPALPL